MTTIEEDLVYIGTQVRDLASATAAGFCEIKKIDESQDLELVSIAERLHLIDDKLAALNARITDLRRDCEVGWDRQ